MLVGSERAHGGMGGRIRSRHLLVWRMKTLGTTAGDVDTNAGTVTLIRFEPRLHDSEAATSSPWPAYLHNTIEGLSGMRCGAREDYDVLRPRRPRRYAGLDATPHQEDAAMSVFRFFEPFRDPARELDRLMSIAASGTRAPLGMPLDVYRDDDGSYHIDLDLPGVDPASIDVTVDSGTLTIQAERTPAYRESQQVIVAERSQGSFARQLSLGEGVDSDNLTAAYTDGVLHVTIPASPRSQPRKVEITHATGARHTISGSTVDQGDAPAPGAGDTD
jgi:HSP20 family protein